MTVVAMKYNPSFLSDDELVASFCVRTNEFTSLLSALRESTGNSNQHQIVIGPRGSGKTSLLLRVAAEVRGAPDLSARFFPIVFAEESYEVATAGEFWLECLSRLADQVPRREDEPDLHRTFNELRTLRDDQILGDRSLGALQDFADREDKRLVLVVENLNMMFGDMVDEDAGWRLRQTLQIEPRILLLASATSRFDEIDEPDRPLYELFRVLQLRSLDVEECATLWRTVSGQHRTMQTIQALRILTGGSPRLLTIVARFGANLSFGQLMADLLNLVDDHTEYFKSHLDALPAQERRVYLALADLWKPATTREIADRSRVEINKCSAYLGRLIDRGAVEVTGGSARRKLYYLAERLYNIYYLMRRARGPAPLIEALIHFMEAYYSPSELKDFGVRIAHEATDFDAQAQRVYRTAFARLLELPSLADHRDELLSHAPTTFLDQFRDYPDPPAVSTDAQDISSRALVFANAGRFSEALALLEEVVQRFGASQEPADREQAAIALVNKGVTLGELHLPEEALAAWDEVVQRFGESDTPTLLAAVATAMLKKGGMLGDLRRLQEALATWHEIEQRFGTADATVISVQLATALGYKGLTLLQLDRPKEALATWEEVVRRFGQSTNSRVLKQVATVLVNTGNLLARLDKPEAALAAWSDVAERFETHDAQALLESVATALTHKGLALAQWGRLEEAVVAWDALVERFRAIRTPALLDAVADALVNKGAALAALSQPEDAIATWSEVRQRFGTSTNPRHLKAVASAQSFQARVLAGLQPPEENLRAWDDIVRRFGASEAPELLAAAAEAMVNKGAVMAELGRLDEALVIWDKVVHRFEASESPELLDQVARALVAKGQALAELNRLADALNSWDEVVRRFGTSDTPEQLDAVADALTNRGTALAELNRPEDALRAWDEIIRRFGTSEASQLLETVAGAMVNKGVMLAESGRREEAVQVWDEAVRRFGSSDSPVLLAAVASALGNKGSALAILDRPEEALTSWNLVVDRFGINSPLAESDPVAMSLSNKSAMLTKLGRLDEAAAICDEIVQRFGSTDEPTHRTTTERALLREAEIKQTLGRPDGAIKAVDNLLKRELEASLAHQLHGRLIRACASLEISNADACTQDLKQVMTILPALGSLPKNLVNTLLVLAVDLGLERLHDLIVTSSAADLLLPLTTALKRELGMESRVAKEIEEVAEDIRQDLARYQNAKTN